MDVAVVIPLYNGAEWIRESLGSVISQTHPPSEIIVVDDGSTDGSPAIVADDFPEVRLVTNPGDGPYEARNYGVECASAENVAFIDQDDLWHEDHLKRIHQAFRELPQAVCAFSKVARFRDSEAPDYSVTGCDPHAYDPWDDYPYNGLGETIGAVIRRSAFEDVDGWWPEAEGGGVHHLWLKLGLIGDVAVTGCRTTAKRGHDEALSHRLRHNQVEAYYARLVNASEDALKRRRQRGLDTERFVPRLEAQIALLDFLRATREEDRSEMKRSLAEFGECMAGEPRTVIRGTWFSFWWHAEPLFEQRGKARSAVDFIDFARQLPPTLRGPREFLYEWSVDRASSLDLIRRHPMESRFWSLLVRRGLRRLRFG